MHRSGLLLHLLGVVDAHAVELLQRHGEALGTGHGHSLSHAPAPVERMLVLGDDLTPPSLMITSDTPCVSDVIMLMIVAAARRSAVPQAETPVEPCRS
jgi:hypothetical protein